MAVLLRSQTFAEQGRARFGHMLFRHVYGDDVIPAMPPRSSGAFEHFGDELVSTAVSGAWIERDESSVRQCHGLVATLAVAMASWVARRLPPLAELPFRYSIDDHAPSRYIDASRTMIVGATAL